jgi:RNA polymerase sigma factor (sigma-70 family)
VTPQPSAEDPDLPLVRALQSGQDYAFDDLMNAHREGLFAFVFRHIPNEADAIELTQEAFIRAYFNIGKFRPRAKFVTWLYQIALNLCRDYTKSRAYRFSSQTIPADTSEMEERPELSSGDRGPAQQTQHREELRALEEAIASLPPDLREPLILTALEGQSHAEAAELLKTSRKAIEVKVYRARRILLEKMSRNGF